MKYEQYFHANSTKWPEITFFNQYIVLSYISIIIDIAWATATVVMDF